MDLHAKRLKTELVAPINLLMLIQFGEFIEGVDVNWSSVLILMLGSAVLLALLAPGWWRKRQLQKASADAFPRQHRQWLRQHWPLYRHLPTDVKLRLHKQIQRFLADKEFIGCDGLVVTAPMRLLIAAQASLLSLNQPDSDYPELRQILIYPDAFVVRNQHADATGIISEQPQVRLGESWTQGQVILSWRHTKAGADAPYDGQNLVFHEFAHQLDQASGSANGAPPQPTLALQQRWAEQMPILFANFCQDIAQGKPRLLDPYGCTNPAEFFAVATECFFERPNQLQLDSPSLYLLLKDYFQFDPKQWHDGPQPRAI